jgi:cell division protein FtsW (lipid II flippase)
MNRVIQSRLLLITAAFLVLQAAVLTLAPAVRLRSWNVDYLFSQWVGIGIWAVVVARAHYDVVRKLPDADPYLLPAAALISGWGMLTIWRLDAAFGARQAIWLGISIGLFSLGTRLTNFDFLRRYKYILLSCGFILAGLTLLFGTNPSGSGSRLWLGYGELYLQPSEPLKLLLVIFLAAYFAERLPARLRIIHILYPTIILSGIVILLLIVQRDLGTAAIFTALYAMIVYLSSGRKRVLLISLVMLVLVSVVGYYFVSIVHVRINSWLNPWDDPSGKSYQIIQSLIAVANGGTFGTGLGLGSPGLVPVAISDFIYAAIGEEAGLLGTLGLLALIALIIARGLRIALRAPDLFRRTLAAGIVTYFGMQTILIVGGNLRLLPLTGVTLPFISYGGSSLLTSFIALLVLMHISNHLDVDPSPLPQPQPYLVLSSLLFLGLFGCALANGWWSVVRGPDLLTRVDNQRRIIESRYVPRGELVDSSNKIISSNRGKIGSYTRDYEYVDLAPIVGYTDTIYGQAGLEAALDEYLSGQIGNPTSTIAWSNLLYGMDPQGLNVRLSIDLRLQTRADELMLGHRGAVILLNAQSGEILIMASHPTFDPNHLSEIGADLIRDADKPLLNRATLGQYPTGSIMEPFAQALTLNSTAAYTDVYKTFRFFQAPEIQLPVAAIPTKATDSPIRVSPLQMALATAALSNHGMIPAPRIAMAINTPFEGWVSLPAEGKPVEAIQAAAADEAISSYLSTDQTYWQYLGRASENKSAFTWMIGGTPPNWQATPLAIVVILQEDNERLAAQIGKEILSDTMHP